MRTPFRLNKTIGEAYDMDLADALTAKQALADLGHLEVSDGGFDEYPDRPLIEAVKSFQRAEGLAEDGVMKPDGPTLARLNDVLKTSPTPAAPVSGRETGPTSLLNPPAEPGTPLARHLASLPARPGAAPSMDSKKSVPEGTQVAMAPAIALIPPLIGLAARRVPPACCWDECRKRMRTRPPPSEPTSRQLSRRRRDMSHRTFTFPA